MQGVLPCLNCEGTLLAKDWAFQSMIFDSDAKGIMNGLLKQMFSVSKPPKMGFEVGAICFTFNGHICCMEITSVVTQLTLLNTFIYFRFLHYFL